MSISKTPLNEILSAHCRALSNCLSHNDSRSTSQNSILSRNVGFLRKPSDSSHSKSIFSTKLQGTTDSEVSLNDYKNINFSSLLLSKMKHTLLVQRTNQISKYSVKENEAIKEQIPLMNNPFISDDIKTKYSTTMDIISSRAQNKNNVNRILSLQKNYSTSCIKMKKKEINGLLQDNQIHNTIKRQKSPRLLNELSAKYNIRTINPKEFFYVNKKKKENQNQKNLSNKSSTNKCQPYEKRLLDLMNKIKNNQNGMTLPYNKISIYKTKFEKIINCSKPSLVSSESQKFIVKSKMENFDNELQKFIKDFPHK